MIPRPSSRYSKRFNPSLTASYLEISNFFRQSPAGHLHACRPSCFFERKLDNQRRFKHVTKSSESNANFGSRILNSYKDSLSFPEATVRLEDVAQSGFTDGDDVVLHGYFSSWSSQSKRLIFINFHDVNLSQSIQVVWNKPKSVTALDVSMDETVRSVEPNSPVAIVGVLKGRQSEGRKIWHTIKNLEVDLRQIRVLNEFPKDIIVTPETVFPPERRHLQLRFNQDIRDALRFRSRAMQVCRDVLSNHSSPFQEIDTPLLFKSTPEGAREFIVPTRRKGYAYALPQSPQQYKQVLMASGISRYFQFARCFRDEDLRADRQPEFTQLDLEMSFSSSEDVMRCIEAVVKGLWSDLLNIRIPDDAFPRMTYEEAMSKYGSDKPDTRIGMEISSVGYLLPVDLISKITHLTDPIVEMIKLSVSGEPRKTREFVSRFMDSPEAREFLDNPEGGPGIFIFDSRKPLQGLQPLGFEAAEVIGENLEDGDLVVLQARKNAPFAGGSTPLGNIRRALHKAAVDSRVYEPLVGFDFRWITDFPLFSPVKDTEPGQGGKAGIASTHHPFTSPKTRADVDLLLSEPTKVIGDHYDLVVNGVELGGGSRRIHHAAMQKFVLKNVLKMPEERLDSFSHLLEALRAGCPPHAGIALGFDRLIAVMLGRESVRDVIAFPKSGRGEDLMVKSPGKIDQKILNTYHLDMKE